MTSDGSWLDKTYKKSSPCAKTGDVLTGESGSK
jgi:hypothetical protein